LHNAFTCAWCLCSLALWSVVLHVMMWAIGPVGVHLEHVQRTPIAGD
jgi:hypothetical protein